MHATTRSCLNHSGPSLRLTAGSLTSGLATLCRESVATRVQVLGIRKIDRHRFTDGTVVCY